MNALPRATGFRSYRVSDFVVDPADVAVVVAPPFGGVYRSTDEGSSWRLARTGVHTPFASWLSISTDERTLHAATPTHRAHGL